MGKHLRLAAGWLALLAALAYYAVVPEDGALDLKIHWAAPPLLVAAGCYLSSLLPRRWFTAALAGCLIAIGSATLFAVWRSGFSDGSMVAGLLPYSDAAGYFGDAQRILLDQPVSSFSSRRPLFPSFLAVVSAAGANRLPSVLWLLVALVSTALAYAAGVLRESWDDWVLPAFFTGLTWLFYRRFIGTTMTEHLGLALGLVGFAWLWKGAGEKCRWSAWCGLLALTLALNARAGAMLVLPAIALWTAAPSFAGKERWDWRTLAVSTAFILAGFAGGFLVLPAVGGERAAAFSNFSYVLYGLVHGGNWTLALQEHPWLGDLAEQERTTRIYSLALERLVDQPLSLLGGMIKSWLLLPAAWFSYISSPRVYLKSSFILWLPATALLPFGVHYIVRHWRQSPTVRLTGYALLGIVLSAPFAPPWDADGARIYGATIPFMVMAGIFGIARLFAGPGPSLSTREARTSGRPYGKVALCAGLAVMFALSLPAARGSRQETSLSFHLAACDGGSGERRFSVLPGTIVPVTRSERPGKSPILEIAEGGPGKTLETFSKRLVFIGTDRQSLDFWRHYRFTPEDVKQVLKSVPESTRFAMLLEHSGDGAVVRMAALGPAVTLMKQGPADDVCLERRGNLVFLRTVDATPPD